MKVWNNYKTKSILKSRLKTTKIVTLTIVIEKYL